MSRGWAIENLIFDGDRYFAETISAIERATESISFESYIYEDDAIGLAVASALGRAARRGVKVRLLVDGFGARNWIERRAVDLAAEGVSVRVYHPLKFSQLVVRGLQSAGLAPVRAVQRLVGALARFNRRDHRKLILIDSRAAWVGSLNVSAAHSARFSGETAAWRDIAAHVEGPGIVELQRGFDFVFRRAHDLTGKRNWRGRMKGTVFQRVSTALVRQNFTFRLRRRNYQEFLRRLSQAKRRIWIVNAYLAPSAPVIRHLTRAAERGIDVRVLVPRRSDVFFMPWVSGSIYPELAASGVRVFEFLPRFHHAKSVVIDGWASVGTSNMNHRSLLRDLEVDVVLRKRPSLKALTEQFEKDLTLSEEIGPNSGSIFLRFLGRLILFFMRNSI